MRTSLPFAMISQRSCRDAKLLKGLVRQVRKDRLVYLVLAECSLILPVAQAPQPDHDVHDGAHRNVGNRHDIKLQILIRRIIKGSLHR